MTASVNGDDNARVVRYSLVLDADSDIGMICRNLLLYTFLPAVIRKYFSVQVLHSEKDIKLGDVFA